MGLIFPALINAESNSFGVSPPSIRNNMLLPGSRYEQEIVISRSEPDNDAVAYISLEGDLSNWITFTPSNEVPMPQGEQRVVITAIVEIPFDANLGAYRGTAMIKMQDPGNVGQVILAPAIAIDINLEVGTQTFSILKVLTADIPDVSAGKDIILNLRMSNEGNSPKALSKLLVKFLDLNEQELHVFETTELPPVSAFSVEDQSITIPYFALNEGEYYAEVEAFSEEGSIYKDKVVFTITEAEFDTLPQTGPEAGADASKVILSTVLMVCGAILIAFVIISFVYIRNKKDKEKK